MSYALHLFPWVDGVFVDGSVKVRQHKVQVAIIAKSSPLRVDEHLLRPLLLPLPRVHILEVLDVAGVCASSCQEENMSCRSLAGLWSSSIETTNLKILIEN